MNTASTLITAKMANARGFSSCIAYRPPTDAGAAADPMPRVPMEAKSRPSNSAASWEKRSKASSAIVGASRSESSAIRAPRIAHAGSADPGASSPGQNR